ncbi:unnamed protein product, partial [Dovyalis caffra]
VPQRNLINCTLRSLDIGEGTSSPEAWNSFSTGEKRSCSISRFRKTHMIFFLNSSSSIVAKCMIPSIFS